MVAQAGVRCFFAPPEYSAARKLVVCFIVPDLHARKPRSKDKVRIVVMFPTSDKSFTTVTLKRPTRYATIRFLSLLISLFLCSKPYPTVQKYEQNACHHEKHHNHSQALVDCTLLGAKRKTRNNLFWSAFTVFSALFLPRLYRVNQRAHPAGTADPNNADAAPTRFAGGSAG